MDSSAPLEQTKENTLAQDMFYDIFTYTVYEKYPLHWHDYYELQYVKSGHGTLIINGDPYELEPGSMALLSPVDFHCFENVPMNDPLKVISVKFSDLILPAGLRTDIYEPSRSMVSHSEQAEVIFQRLHDEYFGNRYGKDDYITAGIVQLCIILLREFIDQKKGDCCGRRTPIQQAVLYVRSHFRGSITVEDVSGLVKLTPNYFSEYFKKQTGIKFSSYVQKLRLEFAVGLLKMTDLSVKQVAEQSGFNSAAYFSNAFKDCFGLSPEQFRKNSLRTVSDAQSTGTL